MQIVPGLVYALSRFGKLSTIENLITLTYYIEVRNVLSHYEIKKLKKNT